MKQRVQRSTFPIRYRTQHDVASQSDVRMREVRSWSRWKNGGVEANAVLVVRGPETNWDRLSRTKDLCRVGKDLWMIQTGLSY